MSKDHHGKGEQDARDNKYERPHGIFDDLTTWSESGMERNRRENEQYDAGYHHGRGQQDASKREYHPPHGIVDDLTTWSHSGQEKNEKENKDYDAGHDGANQSKSGGCFLTTACVDAAGLPDSCHELEVLRHFRDTYLAPQPDGAAMIAEYYAIAPRMVAEIQRAPERGQVLADVLADVRRAVALIDAEKLPEALAVYRAMFLQLRARFPL